MAEVIWTETAILNIDEIAEFIAQDSLFYAQILVEKFLKIEEIISIHPRFGRMIPEAGYNDCLREIIEGNYRIFYEIDSHDDIKILAVYHSSRNIIF